jgi:hypothetical protein
MSETGDYVARLTAKLLESWQNGGVIGEQKDGGSSTSKGTEFPMISL